MKRTVTRALLILSTAALAGCFSVVSDSDNATPKTNDPSGSGSPSPSGGGGSGALSQQEINSLLAVHNQARSEVGVAPLQYSSSLAAYAREWADHLAASGCRMQHRTDGTYGENLAIFSGGSHSPAAAAKMWFGEKSAYRGGAVTQGNLMSVGHYTQMVWRDTTQVGCGRAVCPNGSMIYVCNYNPPGNMLNSMPY